MRLSDSFDIARRRQLVERDRSRTAKATLLFRVLGWAVLVGAVAWLYGPSLHGDLVWDDAARIGVAGNTPRAATYRDIVHPELFLGVGPERYRPLTRLSLRLDLHRGKGEAEAFHLTSVLLHLLNVLLVSAFARRLRLSRGASWFAALIFAVYPLCTYATGHVGGREEALALAFILITFLLHASRRWIYEPIAVVSFALALLARPAAAGAGLVMIAWDTRRGRPLKESILRLAPHAVVGLVMLLIVRHHFGTLGFLSAQEGQPSEILATLPVAWSRLFQLFLRPYLISEPSVLNLREANIVPWVTGGIEPRMLSGLASLLAFGAAVWLTIRGRGRALVPMVALAVLWMPVDSLFFGRAFDLTLNLYAPSMAFALLLALLVERAGFERRAGHLRRALVGGAAAIVALSFVVTSQARLAVWRDEGNVYLEALNRYPAVAAYHAGYGTWLARRGDEMPALDELRRAVTLDPGMALAFHNLGRVQSSLARDAEAAVSFRQAAQLDPGDAGSWRGLAQTSLKAGQPREALDAAQKAILLEDSSPEGHLLVSAARLARGDVADANAEAHRAMDLAPRAAAPYAQMAAVLRATRRLEESLVVASHAVRLDSSSPAAALERGLTLEELGRDSEALDELTRYAALEPHPDPAVLNLALGIRKRMGR